MNVYGLIGYPLGHSFSKQYFTEKFEKENIKDCVFEAFPIATIEEFPALLQSYPDLKGLCVTIPYKEQVLKYVDELSDEVVSIGATNSICIKNNKLIAYNTDIAGFLQSFKILLQPHHTKALVLGAGGASKAVQYVLRQLNIDYVIVSRNISTTAGFIRYEDINEAIINEYSIIINCTPVGMWPNENVCPDIPYELITSKHYLYDLVYKPTQTLFLQKGKSQGAATQNGYEMLVIQAEESWRIWNKG